MKYSVAILSSVDQQLDGQEDLCFALWHHSNGSQRQTALIAETVLPQQGERQVHGNAAFNGNYVERVLALARRRGAGICLLHSHLGPGWQGMSEDDVATESGLAPAAQASTSLPLVGLTLGTDGAWSARFWQKRGPRHYERCWCESVRVVGDAMRITFADTLLPVPALGPSLTRTISAWGPKKQAQ
jgi:molybdopterin-synthase adenylyltransferase